MALEALVVDLDGTVWDSRPWYAKTIADAAGLPVTAVRRNLDSVPLPALIDRTPGISRGSFQRLLESNIDELVLYPGVQETLEALAGRGVVLAVATSLPGWIAVPILEASGLRALFDAVADASSSYRKPNPALLRIALPGIELNTESVLVVGDDERDASLARLGEVGFAWASYGYGTEPDVPKYYRIDAFADLLDL
jgi:HAD superfamily hydrolase (TIGR01509 family)